MRGISEDFIQELKVGALSEILHLVITDNTLSLEVRENTVHLCYRGANILKVTELKNNFYRFYTPLNYIRDKNLRNQIYTLPKTISTSKHELVRNWVLLIPNLKYQIDLSLTNKPKTEKEFQQLIVRENNMGKLSKETDYKICDIEYANDAGRFDLVAVTWSDANASVRLSLIEMKYMDGALMGNCGLMDHFRDFHSFLSVEGNVQCLKEEMKHIFKIKRDLGIISVSNKELEFSNEIPEIIFLIANHNPKNNVLKDELLKIKESDLYEDLRGLGEIKFATACYMGYGLYAPYILPFEEFISCLN